MPAPSFLRHPVRYGPPRGPARGVGRRAPRDGSTGPDGSRGPPRGLPAGPRRRVGPGVNFGKTGVRACGLRNAGNLQPRECECNGLPCLPTFHGDDDRSGRAGQPSGSLGPPRGPRLPGCPRRRASPTAAPSQPVLTDEERDTVELPLWSIALGLVLGLLGSVAINTGNNLQSMGLKELQKREELDEAR